MEYWYSKIPFLNFFELSNYKWMYGKLRLYLLQSCACKVDNFWGYFIISFTENSISRSANITALDNDKVLVVTKVRIPPTTPKLVMLC